MPLAREVWAVLIGINYYPKYEYHPLRGCVQDVIHVKAFLERYKAQISTFTTDSPSKKNHEHRPTFLNITSKLVEITKKAKAGDLVYIHYSGHGARKTPDSNDMALVMLDKKKGNRYFHGFQLARYLKCMIEKGLQVTLVLDSCHSGDVARDADPDQPLIRSVDWDQSIDDNFPISESDKLTIANANKSNSRGTEWQYNWLDTMDESKYLLIAACGPHEKAYEHEQGGQYRGLLSSHFIDFLIRIEESRAHNHSIESLIDHLRVKINQYKKEQSPMYRGNGNFSLLRKISSLSAGYVYVTTEKDRVYLNAGRLHGVCKGDVYAAYPFDFQANGSSIANSATLLEVVAVEGSTCNVEILSENQKVDVGWRARLSTSAAKPIHIRWEAGDGFVGFDTAIRESKYPQILQKGGEVPCYRIITNNHQEYEILDVQNVKENLQRIKSIPKIPLADRNAIRRVVTIIEHIAKFEHIKNLFDANPTPQFKDSFDIKFEDTKGRLLKDHSKIKHMQMLKLTIQNGRQPLHIAMYSLGSVWQINPSDCNVLEPIHRGEKRDGIYIKHIRQQVPEGQPYCDDIIKLVITTSPISVALLRLPELRRQHRETGRGWESPTARDSTDVSIESELFIKPHEDRVRGSNFDSYSTSPVRSNKVPSNPKEWYVHTFHVRTIR